VAWTLLLALPVVMFLSLPAMAQTTYQPNTDRRSETDYEEFVMGRPNPQLCLDACLNSAPCRHGPLSTIPTEVRTVAWAITSSSRWPIRAVPRGRAENAREDNLPSKASFLNLPPPRPPPAGGEGRVEGPII